MADVMHTPGPVWVIESRYKHNTDPGRGWGEWKPLQEYADEMDCDEGIAILEGQPRKGMEAEYRKIAKAAPR